jgi:NitT/TauT family transport system substrate-binding protein
MRERQDQVVTAFKSNRHSERGIQMKQRFRWPGKVILTGVVTVVATAMAASAAVAAPAVRASSTSATAKAPKCTPSNPLTIGQPGIPPVFLTVRTYVAEQQGFYKKYCANVTIKQFTTGTDALRAVQAGQIDLAWSPTPTVLASMAKGADLVGIEGLDVVDWEVGTTDSSVKTCADLKGQTIGVDTVGGARYAALQAMLGKCKLTIQDVKTVNFPGAAAVQAMIAGSLKVSVLHIDEQAQISKLRKQNVAILAKLTDVDPYQHYDFLVALKDSVKAHYYDYMKVLAGDIAASQYMYQPKNIDTVAKIGTITGQSLDISKQAVQDYLKMKWWPLNNPGLGQSKVTRTIGLNVKLGNIPNGALTWKGVVDTRMWKAAYKVVTGKKYTAKAAKAG